MQLAQIQSMIRQTVQESLNDIATHAARAAAVQAMSATPVSTSINETQPGRRPTMRRCRSLKHSLKQQRRVRDSTSTATSPEQRESSLRKCLSRCASLLRQTDTDR